MVSITAGGVSFPLSGNGGTLATTQPVLDLAATWATTGTYVGAIRLNVTDSGPANAASLLFDLQVGGTSKFNIVKNGGVNGAVGVFSILSGTTAFQASSGSAIGWSNGSASTSATTDLALWRDAANTLAQRLGASAQTFNIYNTFTDVSNYERGIVDWSSSANSFSIGTQAAGTGTARDVRLIRGGSSFLTLASGGLSAQNHLLWTPDNTFDIGASGANRPRSIFVANSVTAGGDISAGGILKTGSTVVGSLPTCNAGSKASRHFVTDANATFTAGIGAVVAGGGANNVPVTCDGTNWRIG